MPVLRRNNVHVRGIGERAMVFAHGFGCDQNIWRLLAPCFERDFVTVLFDNVGAGESQLPAYSSSKYASLSAYAEDLVEIGRTLELQNAVLVGHSCGAMIAALASKLAPDMFERLIMIGPSPRYIDDDDGYVGGFSSAQVQQMLDLLASDYPGWSTRMAPLFMGNPERPELTEELIENFQHVDAAVANDLARAVFYSDLRHELPQIKIKSLILQSSEDCVVPESVARYLHRNLPASELRFLNARGHFPQLSAPAHTTTAISAFLKDLPRDTRSTRHKTSGPSVRELVKQGTSILDLPSKDPANADQSYRDETLELLLARSGELTLHLGRYDMYALTLQDLLTEWFGLVDDGRRTLRTRGEHIVQLLSELSPELSTHFVQTHLDLQRVLDRHEISAHHGAVIAGLAPSATQRGWERTHAHRKWFDKADASAEDCLKYLEVVERDVLKVVALCFRVCSCALSVQRLLAPKRR